MYPTSQDAVVAYGVGPQGPAGDVSAAQLTAAIDALKSGVATEGDTLAKLLALINARALLDGAEFSNITVPTQSVGNNSTKAASTAFVKAAVDNSSPVKSVVGLAGDILKADLLDALSLDAVDNTSDATKNAATATLANKTLVAPNIGAATGTSLNLSGDAVFGGTALVAYTPATPTATSGTFTTVTATGKYARYGKWILMRGSLFVTDIGSATGRAKVACPIPSTSGEYFTLTALKESGFAAAVAAVNWDSGGFISISLTGVVSGDVIHYSGIYAAS